MDISSRLSQYGRLALNKTIIGNKEDKGKQEESGLKKEDEGKGNGFCPREFDCDALTLLAMQNKGLINIQAPTVPAPSSETPPETSQDAPPEAPEEPTTPPTVNTPAFTPDVSGSDPLKAFEERIAGDEFDKDVSKNEALDVINEYTELLVSDLKSKYNMSDEFLNTISDFAISELDLKDGNTYNLKNVLKSVKAYFDALTGETVYWRERCINFNVTENGPVLDSWDEYEWCLTDSFLASSSFTDIFLIPRDVWENDLLDSDDVYRIQNSFLGKLYDNIFEKLGISDDQDKNSFRQSVKILISEKLGISVENLTPKDILENINSNNNAGWIDEYFDIINTAASKLNLSGWQDVDKIDADVLFDGQDYVDAKFLANHFESWRLDGASGAKKLQDMIQNTMNNYGISNYYDEENLFAELIKIINNTLGIENTNPPTLSKDAINKLNENDIFGTIKNILESNELKTEYYTGTIDGVINDFGQGKTGDCWLLSGLMALSASEKGRQCIKDAIVDNGDGTYTVSFIEYKYGINKHEAWSGVITIQDIIEARESGVYSHGDADVLLIELALEKCWLERKPEYADMGRGWIIGPAGSVFIIKALADNIIMPEFRGLSNEKLFEYKYEDFKNGNITMTCSFPECVTVKDINGNNVKLIDGHEYAVTDLNMVDNDPSKSTVTIVNPYSSDKPIVLSWEEFTKTNATLDIFYDRTTFDAGSIIEPYINGDITLNDLIGTVLSLRDQISDEQKELLAEKIIKLSLEDINVAVGADFIFNTISLLEPEGFINIFIKECANSKSEMVGQLAELIKNLNGVNNFIIDSYYDSVTENIFHTIVFDFNGKHYEITQKFPVDDRQGEYHSYMPQDIYKYTKNQDIINKYFEVAVSVDGQPLVYRLKDGVTFAQFKAEATINNIHNGHISDTSSVRIDIADKTAQLADTVFKESGSNLRLR